MWGHWVDVMNMKVLKAVSVSVNTADAFRKYKSSVTADKRAAESWGA